MSGCWWIKRCINGSSVRTGERSVCQPPHKVEQSAAQRWHELTKQSEPGRTVTDQREAMFTRRSTKCCWQEDLTVTVVFNCATLCGIVSEAGLSGLWCTELFVCHWVLVCKLHGSEVLKGVWGTHPIWGKTIDGGVGCVGGWNGWPTCWKNEKRGRFNYVYCSERQVLVGWGVGGGEHISVK